MSGYTELVSKTSYVSFVLGSFGLQRLIPRVFVSRELDDDSKPPEMQELRNTDRGEYNMHTGGDKPPISIMGTPVFADAILDVDGVGRLQLLWVLFDVQQTHNIIETQPLGRDGTVKEYINEGDFQVTIRGAFSDTFKVSYPKAMVESLIKLCRSKKPLKVTSPYLQMFGIYNLVVKSYRMGQEQGKQNTQWYEVTCSSDVPVELSQNKQISSGVQ